MLPILDFVQQKQEFPVLLIALVGVAGEGTEDGGKHTHIGQDCQQQVDQRPGEEHGDQAQDHTATEDPHIQLVVAVAAYHKLPETVGNFVAKLAKPVTETIHMKSPCRAMIYPIILQKTPISTVRGECLRIV